MKNIKFRLYYIASLLLILFLLIIFKVGAFGIIPSEKVRTSSLSQEDSIIGKFPETSIGDIKYKKALWPNPETILVSLGIKPNMIVLDLCSGDGYFTVPLCKITSKTYGLELDPTLIKQAIKAAAKQKITNCIWIQGDARNLKGLIKEEIDFVLLANTFHGVPQKQILIKDIYSVLKPNGQLAIINWHKKFQRDTIVLGIPCGPEYTTRMFPQQVQEIVELEGFRLTKFIKFPPHHYGMIFRKIEIQHKLRLDKGS